MSDDFPSRATSDVTRMAATATALTHLLGALQTTTPSSDALTVIINDEKALSRQYKATVKALTNT